MGRLPCNTADADTFSQDGDGAAGSKRSVSQVRPDQRLPDNFEEWRHRPDLCLMWAAFCAPSSTLTLADGVLLAKTRKSSSQVLKLLAGDGLPDYDLDRRTAQQVAKGKNGDESNARVKRNVNEELPRWSSNPRDSARGEMARSADTRSDRSDVWSAERPMLGSRIDAGEASLGGDTSSKGAVQSSGEQDETSGSDPCGASFGRFCHCVEVAFEPWDSGNFAQVARLAKSVHGEVRYLTAKDGTGVVAKVVPTGVVEQSKVREGNERSAWFKNEEIPIVEDLWNEIAVLIFLQRQKSLDQCSFLIRLLGLFQDPTSTYLVTEYCNGGDLFERVAYGDALAEGDKKRYVSQLLQAVQHLHRHNVGHRDISLENVLLRGGDCVLMDFGQAVRLKAEDGTVLRYYAEAGKRMYRAPEMYVPRERPINVICPSDGASGAVAQVSYDRCRCEVLLPSDAVIGKPCVAEPHGYAAAPADIFACGVCTFVLLVGKPPWNMARDTDPTFSFIRRHGIPMLLHQWKGGGTGRPGGPPAEDELLLGQMLRMSPVQRSGVDECLDSPWLDSVAPPRTRTQSVKA